MRDIMMAQQGKRAAKTGRYSFRLVQPKRTTNLQDIAEDAK
jgi:hypothetical protein